MFLHVTKRLRGAIGVLGICFLLTGCQSYQQGVELVCNLLVSSGADQLRNEKMAAAKAASYLRKELKNSDVAKEMGAFVKQNNEGKIRILNKMAKKAKLEHCALAETLQKKVELAKRQQQDL